MKCKICGSESLLLFKAAVLNKYDVGYYQCSNCEFIQTENPYWLNEAYTSVIADLDVGLVSRNLEFSEKVEEILLNYFKKDLRALDYGGGYGLFVRLMRDKGFDFYRHDLFCQNTFAKFYNVENVNENERFDLVTSFEVFEHLANPLEEINKMFSFGDNVLFSTVIVPEKKISKADDWWYFIPDTGQHVSFYSIKSLEKICASHNMYFYSNRMNLHLFSKNKLSADPFKGKNAFSKLKSFFSSPLKKNEPLTERDFKEIKKKLLG
jgi:2-polyprenyl-3-methyl-5-hydroxy-6-metoxy-1,4-benzoquinol methylase